MQEMNISEEEFYKMDRVYDFIALCNARKKCIISIELFKIKGKQIIPYADLLSIDTTGLFNERNDKNVNIELCNKFVKNCVDKCYDEIKELYFNPVLEY